jgi:hypothetical protein
MSTKRDRRRAAAVGGVVGATGTGSTLVGITAGLSGPAANLGGYATAQIVASGVGAGSIGIGGPALATAVAFVGGPIVAGAILTVGVGAAIGGAVYGIRKLL